MEQKNRRIITLLIILLIVVAMFTSFGRSLFSLNTPRVELPDTQGSSSSGGASPGGASEYLRVEVTPETVQSVIATLARSDSYYREVTVETFWADGSATGAVQVWTDGGWTHTRQALSSGAIRHDLVGPQNAYYWYDGSSQYRALPADELSADLAQRLPTYETVLALDVNNITAAGYETRGELACVYAEVADEELGYLYRYWVDIPTGLLISAETEKDGALVYRMTAYAPLQTPCPASASFNLPDGSDPRAE